MLPHERNQTGNFRERDQESRHSFAFKIDPTFESHLAEKEALLKSAIDQEFETVELILKSDARTRNVDAFCLTWIKLERQLRKLTANILYQATAFPESDVAAKELLRATLLAKNNIKHDHFIGGIRRLTGQSMKEIIGDQHKELRVEVNRAYDFQNKIIHGQQTGQNLDKDQLASTLTKIREWCTILAEQGTARFGYDGFARNSLHKTRKPELVTSVDGAIAKAGWQAFVQNL